MSGLKNQRHNGSGPADRKPHHSFKPNYTDLDRFAIGESHDDRRNTLFHEIPVGGVAIYQHLFLRKINLGKIWN
jgi:hypothetical protein